MNLAHVHRFIEEVTRKPSPQSSVFTKPEALPSVVCKPAPFSNRSKTMYVTIVLRSVKLLTPHRDGPISIVYLLWRTDAIPVHRAYLTAMSPSFKAALEGPFKEATSGEYRIDANFESDTVKSFIEWTYTAALTTWRCQIEDSADPGNPTYRAWQEPLQGMLHLDELIKLYIFADRYDIPQLRRESLDAIMAACNPVGKYERPLKHDVRSAFD